MKSKRVKVKVGSTVRYFQISKIVETKVIDVKKDGKLILDTKKMGLIKNVCVMPSRVKVVR